MSDQPQAPYPAQQPPAPRPISPAYRRWATALVWIAVILLAFVVVATVASFVLLGLANASSDAGAYGYLAIFLWFAVFAVFPVLLGTGIPGLVMRARVRRTPQALGGTAP
ncbi:hypothetical protein [Promicromonospora kroppenstedtii]|uniref:hypothetical protein n=1 Tax=Promicromonospora kroppenstedtii TaxID=440482 RepID=UPI0004B24B23|nr:hypothetical protein [Promicromonospora kroppenstedtii]